jgi:hypothetical protein
VAISWRGSIGGSYHDEYTPHVLPVRRQSKRSVTLLTAALQTSLPCRRDTNDDTQHASLRDERIVGCSARSALLPGCYIGILAEMFDILFDQLRQLPWFAHLDPVVD